MFQAALARKKQLQLLNKTYNLQEFRRSRCADYVQNELFKIFKSSHQQHINTFVEVKSLQDMFCCWSDRASSFVLPEYA